MGDLSKLIVAKGFKKLPKVQKNATSGHTDTTQAYPYYAKLDKDYIIVNKDRSKSGPTLASFTVYFRSFLTNKYGIMAQVVS